MKSSFDYLKYVLIFSIIIVCQSCIDLGFIRQSYLFKSGLLEKKDHYEVISYEERALYKDSTFILCLYATQNLGSLTHLGVEICSYHNADIFLDSNSVNICTIALDTLFGFDFGHTETYFECLNSENDGFSNCKSYGFFRSIRTMVRMEKVSSPKSPVYHKGFEHKFKLLIDVYSTENSICKRLVYYVVDPKWLDKPSFEGYSPRESNYDFHIIVDKSDSSNKSMIDYNYYDIKFFVEHKPELNLDVGPKEVFIDSISLALINFGESINLKPDEAIRDDKSTSFLINNIPIPKHEDMIKIDFEFWLFNKQFNTREAIQKYTCPILLIPDINTN